MLHHQTFEDHNRGKSGFALVAFYHNFCMHFETNFHTILQNSPNAVDVVGVLLDAMSQDTCAIWCTHSKSKNPTTFDNSLFSLPPSLLLLPALMSLSIAQIWTAMDAVLVRIGKTMHMPFENRCHQYIGQHTIS